MRPEIHAALIAEQEFLDQAMSRYDRTVAHLRAEIEVAAEDRLEQARRRELRRRLGELEKAQDGLVFGRLDGLDGTVLHIGRVGLRSEEGDSGSQSEEGDSGLRSEEGETGLRSEERETGLRSEEGESAGPAEADPLLLDWRAPAARPFYTATAREPQGQARRRHVRTRGREVVGVDDEPLDGSAGGDLVGEGALLAALDQRRTGRMTTAIATLQREQDDIIRAQATGPLIVQGGPGTGKTVVALHRVAYLLFTHRRMAEQAVLVLGPSPRFLDYIGQVLPALGETAVVSATCDTLLPGVAVERAESRAAAEIKGRALWQGALERYVRSLLPPVRELRLRWAGEFYVISAESVGQAFASAVQGRPYHRAREAFEDQLHQLLADAVAEQRVTMLEQMEEGYEDLLARFDRGVKPADDRYEVTGSDVDGLLSEEEIVELRDRIAEDSSIARFVASWWPARDPLEELRRLCGDEALLHRFAPELTDGEISVVTAEPPTLSSGDIALLDALADLLGEPETPQPQGEFLADRARRNRGWVYGHVVVDEAQELSEMQWQMVLRRCPSRSITAVGDIDQAEAAHRHTTWAQAVQSTLGERWTAAELTVCYRTPREVMALTGPVLANAGSRNAPPRAVRSSGIEPWLISVTPDRLLDASVQAIKDLRQRWYDGSVGVIAPTDRIDELKRVLPDVPVLTATQSKGLEWDATLLVDPDGIAAEPRGWNGLYVALTRCTQELGRVTIT